MQHEWQELTKILDPRDIVVKKVFSTKSEISIEGDFDLPPR